MTNPLTTARTGRLDAGKVVTLLVGLFAAGSWLYMLLHLDAYQWDFKIYYHATEAYAQGRDPYDPRTLSALAEARIRNGYAYPPATLFFFRPFTLASFEVARHLFFALKTLLVIGLITLWRRRFIEAREAPYLYLLCLLGFNCTIYLDLRAGNVSLIEQALLWLAFYCYLGDRLGRFCVLVILAAAFKQLPILFLLLLLVRPDARRLKWLLASGLTFGGLIAASYLAEPELFRAFLENARQTNTESKILNPSTYAFSQDLAGMMLANLELEPQPLVGTCVYGALVAIVLTLSLVAFRRLARVAHPERALLELFLFCLLYALVVPRLKDYSLIVLIPAAARVAGSYARTLSASPLLVAVACTPVTNIPMPGVEALEVLLRDYYPLVIAAVLWGIALRYVRKLDPPVPVALPALASSE